MTYTFRCKICKRAEVIEAKMSEVENLKPVCCHEEMVRVYDAPGIRFNGPGFYSTDNKKNDKE